MKTRIQKRSPFPWETKQLLLWLCFAIILFSSPATYAQLVNGDFESSCGSTTANAFQTNSFVTACVTGPWFVSHGSPDIFYNAGAIDNINTTASAHMWSKRGGPFNLDQEGEGLFIECPNFEKDVRYSLSFRYSSVNLDNIYISLAQGLVHCSTHNSSHPVVTKSLRKILFTFQVLSILYGQM